MDVSMQPDQRLLHLSDMQRSNHSVPASMHQEVQCAQRSGHVIDPPRLQKAPSNCFCSQGRVVSTALGPSGMSRAGVVARRPARRRSWAASVLPADPVEQRVLGAVAAARLVAMPAVSLAIVAGVRVMMAMLASRQPLHATH